jgi:hypothetical protein
MKKASLLLVTVFILIGSFHMQAQDAKFQSLIIYNFTKLIDWPNKSGNFVVKVLGNSELVKELKDFTADRKACGKQAFDIQKAEINNIDNCQILFVGLSESDNIEQIVEKVKNNPSLIITEKSDLIGKGAGISFVKVDGTWKFQFKEDNIKKNGLKVSLDFKELGIAK